MARTEYDEHGAKKVYGNKTDMKESQAYPQAFTDFVADKHIETQHEISEHMQFEYERESSDSDYELLNNESWSDCDLGEWISVVQTMWANNGGCPV